MKNFYMWTDGKDFISEWKLSWKERILIFLSGWIKMNITSEEQPKIYMKISKYIFEKKAIFLSRDWWEV
jgi:hypothetical protein